MDGDWWYCSSPQRTFAVRVLGGRVVEGPPSVRRFLGQSPKRIGDWLRSHGEAHFHRLHVYDYVYRWGNNPKRVTLRGRSCRVVLRGTTMRSVLVEFENGQQEVVSYRALKLRDRQW